MAQFCTGCGTPIPPNGKFCSVCGKPAVFSLNNQSEQANPQNLISALGATIEKETKGAEALKKIAAENPYIPPNPYGAGYMQGQNSSLTGDSSHLV